MYGEEYDRFAERIEYLLKMLESRYGTPWWVYGDNEDIHDEIERCKKLISDEQREKAWMSVWTKTM